MPSGSETLTETTFGSDYVGYDAEFGKYSPGMYLVMKVVEGFCDGHREGVTEVDFGTGHAQYKQVLSNQEWRETSVYISCSHLQRNQHQPGPVPYRRN